MSTLLVFLEKLLLQGEPLFEFFAFHAAFRLSGLFLESEFRIFPHLRYDEQKNEQNDEREKTRQDHAAEKIVLVTELMRSLITFSRIRYVRNQSVPFTGT